MDYIIFYQEINSKEKAFLCTSKAELRILFDALGMSVDGETFTRAISAIEGGKQVNLENSVNKIKLRVDGIEDGDIKFEYVNLVIANDDKLIFRVRNILDIVKL
ncbi:hypothetical protein [Pedobacter jeongneungensis]|uniref:hypothetical protein n=1 Tax=Pedobacter jeongneungensis TaxID=947309 RepID=UPI00046A06D7|nr:hypothetical protein [Pedobacter jeongneungensis]